MNQNELKMLVSKKLRSSGDIYNELTNATPALHFGEALTEWLLKITGTDAAQGDDLLRRCSEIICREFSFKQVPAQLEPSDLSLKKQSMRWLKAGSVTRETVMLLGFGLGMRLADVERFLTQTLLEQGLNPKDPFETIAWYSFKNNLGYHGFIALREQFEQSKPCACAPEDLSSTLTGGLRRTRDRIQSKDALMAYLARIAVPVKGHVQSMTARGYFMDMYREFARLVGGADAAAPESAQNTSLLEKTLYPSTPVKNKNLAPFRNTPLGDVLRYNRLTRQRTSRIVNGTSAITRDDLITLRFALDIAQGQPPLAKHFINSADAMLIDCAMSTMSARIPYDKLLTLCALTDDPLACFDEVFARCYAQETSDD